MRKNWFSMRFCSACMVAGITCLSFGTGISSALVTKYIQGMAPNWEQPYDYPDLFDGTGPGPWPGPGSAFEAWCTPTSAAMLAGHWEDRIYRMGMADGFADGNQGVLFGYSGIPWGGGPTWHDYCADGLGIGVHPLRGTGARAIEDIGWYLDTNNIGDPALPNGPHTGTQLGDVAPGFSGYLQAVGTGVGQPAEGISVATFGVDPVFGAMPVLVMCQTVAMEIDRNRSVLGHFSYWNIIGPGGPGNGNGTEVKEQDFGYSDYSWGTWNPNGPNGEKYNERTDYEGLGHTVLIVGYTMDDQGTVTHLIVHDNWPSTVRNVRIPVGPQLVAITVVGGAANLGVPVLTSGQNGLFELSYSPANTPSYLAYSLKGLGNTYVSFLNVTLNLKAPKQAGGMVVSDGFGFASWLLPIPAGAAGRQVWFEAAQNGVITNVVPRVIQ